MPLRKVIVGTEERWEEEVVVVEDDMARADVRPMLRAIFGVTWKVKDLPTKESMRRKARAVMQESFPLVVMVLLWVDLCGCVDLRVCVS